MPRIALQVLSRASWLAGLALFLLVFGVLYARGGGGPSWWLAALLVVLLVIVLGLVVAVLSANLAGVDPDISDFAEQLTDDPLSGRLMERWLRRVRWRRWVAGFLGLIVGQIVASSVNEDIASAAFFYPALGAVCVASMSAELYLLRGRTEGARTADLSVRQLGDYANRNDQLVMAAIAVAAVVAIVWTAVADSVSATVGWGLGALAVLGVAHLLQRGVVSRGRPAVAPELREADDLLRSIAVSRGVARPAICLALITLGVGFGLDRLEGLEAIAWILGIGTWWFNRGLGLRRFIAQRQGAVAA